GARLCDPRHGDERVVAAPRHRPSGVPRGTCLDAIPRRSRRRFASAKAGGVVCDRRRAHRDTKRPTANSQRPTNRGRLGYAGRMGALTTRRVAFVFLLIAGTASAQVTQRRHAIGWSFPPPSWPPCIVTAAPESGGLTPAGPR